jgi:hypothetical protein
VPNWPDPESNGAFEKSKLALQELGVNSSRLQGALNACRHLLANGGPGQPTQSSLRLAWNEMRTFARCMRARGVQNFPDPTASPQHPERPTFNLQPVGIDPNTPQITSEIHACEPLLHAASSLQNLGLGGS